MKLPPRATPGKLVSADIFNELRDYVAASATIHCGPGLEVRHMQGGVFISLAQSPADLARAGVRPPTEGGGGGTYAPTAIFFGRILSIDDERSYPDGNWWVYQFEEVQHTGTGYDAEYLGTSQWTHVGRVGIARNTCENDNAAEGLQGNGVDVDNLPEGFSIQPVPVGAIVILYQVGTGDAARYWFSYENGVDGAC